MASAGAGRGGEVMYDQMNFRTCLLYCFITCVCFVGVRGAGDVGIYELKKGNFSVKFTNWGATIVSLVLPDKNGALTDIALGYDSVNEYKILVEGDSRISLQNRTWGVAV